MIDNLNLTEILTNANENHSKTRIKKINPLIGKYYEDARNSIKYSRLSLLEEDEEFVQKEE